MSSIFDSILRPNYGGLLLANSFWALFLLRIIVGVIFAAHGLPKLKDLKTTQSNFEAMGFRPGKIWGTIVAILESIGSLLILIGVNVQFFAFFLAIEMIVAAIWRIKQGHKFVGGYELDLLLIAALLILATMGGGALGLDVIW